MSQNRVDIPAKIHMIAICGTGMGALALLMREVGVRVTGSDLQNYPPMGDLLREAGVEVKLGFMPENIPEDTEYVVVGNAVSRDNPEVKAVGERGLPYGSFPESLARYFLCDRKPIVVAGTHGKTTTTALLAWLLESSGNEPGFLVGGEPKNFHSSSRLGRGPYFVVEGDEYDSAFFLKEPKFLHYRPHTAIFTSFEYDHADIYPDLESLRKEFVRFVRLIPRGGLLLVCSEYRGAVEISRSAACKVETYGYTGNPDWKGALAWNRESGTATIEIAGPNGIKGEFPVPLPGEHNGLNVLGALGLLHHLGVSHEDLNRGLNGFLGVRRRQEIIAEVGGVLLLDDFAHHPTAVRETLRAIRMRFPGRRICAVFEPRTHTSRRRVFQAEYAGSFGDADLSFCRKVYHAEGVPPEERFDPEAWVKDLTAMGKQAFYETDEGELQSLLLEKCRSGDVVVFMSSGNLSKLIDGLKDNLESK